MKMNLSNIPTSGTNAMLVLNHLMEDGKQLFDTKNLSSFNNQHRNMVEEELVSYQIQEFIKYIQSPARSRNAYNDAQLLQETLSGAAILEQNSFCHLNGVRFVKGLAKGRAVFGDDWDVQAKFRTLFSFMGYLPQFPILFDRNWCIIDGYHRFLAAGHFKTMEVPYIRYDIDLMSDWQRNNPDNNW